MYTEKLPPHNLEAEEAVIGSLLIDGQAVLRVAELLQPEDFYRERNALCYKACLSLFERNEPVNPISLADELKRQNRLEDIGGEEYLSQVIYKVPTSVYVEQYARIVHEKSVLRRLGEAAGKIATIAYDESLEADVALRRAEDELFRLRLKQSSRDFSSLRDILQEYLAEARPVATGTAPEGAPVTTGFRDLDRLLGGGLHPSDMIVLAARPSLGKTSLALNIARNAALNQQFKYTVAIFSLEMGKDQVAMRLLSSEAKVDTVRLRGGTLSDEENQRISDKIGELSEAPIYIDDSPLLSAVEMRSKARRLHMSKGIHLLILDYMQLMGGDSRIENRVQEMSQISRSIKGLARDLNVPVIAVSQLSRAIEMRPSPSEPRLSDLRESGSIEQDADAVAFIHRPDRTFTEDQWYRYQTNQGTSEPYPKNIAEIILAKHRHGPVGRVTLYFEEQYARFQPTTRRVT